MVVLLATIYTICEWIWPRETIDIAEQFNFREYTGNPGKYGNHKFEIGKTKASLDKDIKRRRFSVKLE